MGVALEAQVSVDPDSWVDREIGVRMARGLERAGLTNSSVPELSLLLPLAGAALLLGGPSVSRGLAAGGLMLLGYLLDVGARQLPPTTVSNDWVEHLTHCLRMIITPLVFVAMAVGISSEVPVLAIVALGLALVGSLDASREHAAARAGDGPLLLKAPVLAKDPGLLYVLVLTWGLDDLFGPLFLALAVMWVAGTFRETPQVATASAVVRVPVPSGGDDAPRSSVIFGATVRTFRY